MPKYQLRIINEHFDQSVELDAPDMASARKKAITTAMSIAADEVSEGGAFFGAELIIMQDETRVCRQIISVVASPLKN